MNSPKQTKPLLERFGSEWIFFAAILVACALYFPGLGGGYFFDDYPNIVDNVHLHVDSMDWRQWLQAVWSSPSTELQRPLASLTFAINYFASGLAPWPMKAVNLGIHLLNGCLWYLLLLRIVASLPSAQSVLARNKLLVAIVASLWLLHPINLTPALYVVQRMESLAQVFVLGGLLLYVSARTHQDENARGSAWRLWLGFPLMLLLGVAAKESAALLPLYALIVELVLRSSGDSKQRPRSLAAFFGLFLLAPAIIGTTWLLPHVLSATAYANRSFTLAQRLLTEPRVLMDYIGWTLAPIPSSFSFYHDTIVISTSLLSPWTTLLSIAALAAMVVAGVLLRKSRPLATLGIFWFLAAHAMTATIIPLELAFEHRNYFASAGLLLAAVELALPKRTDALLPIARYALVSAFVALCCFSLTLRVKEWSNPVSLALAEASRNPDSPRATYDLGRTYVVLSGYRSDSQNLPRAITALEAAARVPHASVLPEAALVMAASRTDQPIDPAWWDSFEGKLSERTPTTEDVDAIRSLTECYRTGSCPRDDDRMLRIYLAALGHERPDASVLYSYAIFAFNKLNDPELALQLARESTKASHDVQYRINLINYLITMGHQDEARAEIAALKDRNHWNGMGAEIANLQRRLDETSAARSSP